MRRLIFALPALMLTACASTSSSSLDTANVSKLRTLSSAHASVEQVSGIRYTALRDAALSLGARAGLASRASELNNMLETNDRLLSRTFNFQRLLLEKNVIPPVLVESRNTLDMKNYDTIRAADRTFAIYRQAQFVSASPTWRDYLILNFDKPEAPDRTLLPRNKAERLVWERYIDQGWQAGIEQANNIYTESLGRLKRDFTGMIRYRSLLAQNMVSAPFVATMDLGVTSSDGELVVNDRILRITDMPSFTANPHEWSTELTAEPKVQDDNDMRY